MTWLKTCVICSSPAEFNIFDKIPAFLHAEVKEHLKWQTPINELIQITTGLTFLPTDGLPHNMCAVCISYLKHAATFRNRAVENWQNLRAIQLLLCSEKKKTDDDDDKIIMNSQTDTEDVIKKPLFSISPSGMIRIKKKRLKKLWNLPAVKDPPTEQEINQQLRLMSINFGQVPFRSRNKYLREYEQLPTYENKQLKSTNDEPDAEPAKNSATAGECLFSYNEKPFQEDDVMEMNGLREAIGIREPENCIERKCRACHNRFLFDDTFNDHLNDCPEYKFLLLIEELNLLLEIRRKKAVSPHEYIRRVIFAIRKICDWLSVNYDEVITLPTCMSKNMQRPRSVGDGCHNELAISKKTRANSENNQSCRKESPIMPGLDIITTLPKIDFKNILANIDLNFKTTTTTTNIKTPLNGYVAKCSTCKLNFTTICEFEKHNMIKHNPKKLSTYKNAADLV